MSTTQQTSFLSRLALRTAPRILLSLLYSEWLASGKHKHTHTCRPTFLVATWSHAWLDAVTARAGWPGVCILPPGETELLSHCGSRYTDVGEVVPDHPDERGTLKWINNSWSVNRKTWTHLFHKFTQNLPHKFTCFSSNCPPLLLASLQASGRLA